MDDEDRCDLCGSTDFTVEDDGHTYCANGHEQARGAIVAEDDQDFGRQGKVVKKKEKKGKQKVSRVLRGAKAYQMFLQAWQFILWKQCHTLVHLKGMPPELWTIVRDLWSLWLSKLEHRLHDSSKSQPQTEFKSEGELQGTSGDDTETDIETDTERTSKHIRAARRGPFLIDTIALNYLGIILLRIPIGLATVLKWIQIEDIPIIRAIRHVPKEMKDRLPSEYLSALDRISFPKPEDLQLAIYRRSMMYNVFFSMVTPPLNHSLLFISYIRSLALPVEVYSLTQRLNKITKYNFSYQDQATLSAYRRQATTYPEAQIISLIVTATKLLFPFDSDQVDRHPKSPNDPTTIRMNWSAWLDAKTEFETSQFNPSTDGLKPGSEIHIQDTDIFTMSNTQLDQYMDWYQRTWLKPTPASGKTQQPQIQTQTLSQNQNTQEEPSADSVDQTILNLFPLRDIPDMSKTREQHAHEAASLEAALTDRIKRVQASLTPIRAINAEEEIKRGVTVLRPGARYPRYRTVEDLAQAGEAVRAFHEEAAQVACLTVKSLLMAVGRTEEIIEAWRREMRRGEVFADDDDDEGDEGDEGVRPSSSGLVRDMDEMGLGHGPSSATAVAGGEDIDNGGEDRDIEMELAMEYLPEL